MTATYTLTERTRTHHTYTVTAEGIGTFRETYRAAGTDDTSGRHSTLASYGPCPHCNEPAYVPECAACWLGHGHTCQYHQRSLNR